MASAVRPRLAASMIFVGSGDPESSPPAMPMAYIQQLPMKYPQNGAMSAPFFDRASEV